MGNQLNQDIHMCVYDASVASQPMQQLMYFKIMQGTLLVSSMHLQMLLRSWLPSQQIFHQHSDGAMQQPANMSQNRTRVVCKALQGVGAWHSPQVDTARYSSGKNTMSCSKHKSLRKI